ncbi:unnamed protein product [Miscanthus lutarioriparius]|uniref:Uncharacterized protein n=1 Tax=Miscanthus lutarioriparius TaxID=422564 RepID=A0A811RXD0_9POAL|nr:unnamed protein product [Miscanthus lutarioriparius]
MKGDLGRRSVRSRAIHPPPPRGTPREDGGEMSAAAGGLRRLLLAASAAGAAEVRASIFGHALNPTGKRAATKLLG